MMNKITSVSSIQRTRSQTWAPRWCTKNPLDEYPINAPTDETNPQRLCMSGASDGRSMLFLAIHASIVTSAMVIAPTIPTRQSSAVTIGNLPYIDMISAVEAPKMPYQIKKIIRSRINLALIETTDACKLKSSDRWILIQDSTISVEINYMKIYGLQQNSWIQNKHRQDIFQ